MNEAAAPEEFEARRQASFHGLSGGRPAPWSTPQERIDLANILREFRDDPLGFALWAYPWGVKGTRLEEAELEKWQVQVLDSLGKQIRAGVSPIRIGVSSGHGIGKTGLMAMLNHWFVACHPDPQCVVTANTDQQLRNKTWRELAVWVNMSRLSWMFQWNATTLRHRDRPETWYSTAVPWSEGNAEAFAGTHERHVMLLFDEASKIAPAIWEMAFGALTTPGAIMIVFGNPTQNTGYFYDIFGKMRKFWSTLRVDSRTIKGKFVNRKLHQEWVDFYGVDSDFVRVKVRGMHPLQGSLQFIPSWLVEAAEKKQIKDEHLPNLAPKVMGVDVAREGDDHSTLVWRKSKKMYPHYERLQIRDLMKLAAHVAKRIDETQPDVCFIDALGMGAGVYDRLVMLGYGNIVIPVYWGKAALEKKVYINLRVECWARMKAWLDGADIPEDAILHEELIGPQFGYEKRTERLSLETKREMKKRGLDSPDVADALALTFAEFVAHRVGGVGESRVVAPEAA